MFGSLGAPELIIVAVVVILLFGVGKVSGLGRELGTSIKEFRRAVKEDDQQQPPVQQTTTQAPPPPVQAPPVQQQYTPPAPQQQPPQQPPQGEQKNPNVF
mgnify:CR=1 FL=1